MSAHDLVTAILVYLLVGSLIWMLMDPVKYADFMVSRYVQRNGKLPAAGFHVLAVMIAIVAWPRVLLELVRAGWGA